jgi:chromate reductase
MVNDSIKIVAICGSLRESSSNSLIIETVSRMLPANVKYTIYKDMAKIPAFDDGNYVPDPVADFRKLVNESDGVFICTPEYAFGVPGTLKNALDWTVGTGEFVDKPLALITAASLGKNAHAALLLIFKAISANIPEGGSLLIPYIRTKIDQHGAIKDDGTKEEIMKVMQSLIDLIKENKRTAVT